MKLAHLHSHHLHGAMGSIQLLISIFTHTLTLSRYFTSVAHTRKLQRSSINRRKSFATGFDDASGAQTVKEIKNLTNKHFSSDRKLSLWMNEWMQKMGKLVLSSKWWGHNVPAGPVFAFSTLVLQLSEAHLVEMVPDWAGRSRDAAFEEHIHSFFSWNDALKLEEGIFGKERFFSGRSVCLEAKSACQENQK